MNWTAAKIGKRQRAGNFPLPVFCLLIDLPVIGL